MYFCPFCGNILIFSSHVENMVECSTCIYIYKITSTIQKKEARKTKPMEKIISEEENLKYGNRCEIQCPSCPSKEAHFQEIQTRSADEPMTIFYRCISCKNTWKD